MADVEPIFSPVFVVGSERSGSTMILLMLDHHPRISFPNQYEFIVDWIGDDGSYPPLPTYWAYLERNPMFQRSKLTVDRTLGFDQLANHFLRQKAAPTDEAFGGTVHRHFGRLLHLWPNARFIHLHRDPRAVARSCMQMGWAGNVWTGAARWVEAEREWERICADVPAERRMDLSYEELVSSAQPQLERVCTFLGLEYDPAMLRYGEDTTYEAPDPKLLGRWRTQLTAREKQLVEARVGRLLVARGYEPSGLPAIDLNPMEEHALLVHDRVARARFRMQRYGLRLWMENLIASRVGPQTWRGKVAEQVRRVEDGYIK